jgi:hypothetical protein
MLSAMNDTNPPELVGTWVGDSSVLKSGKPPLPPQPANVPKVTYTFMADGSGTMMPGTIAACAMHWKVEDGRLRLTTSVPKTQSTHDYETPDPVTLVLFDRHGGRNVFKRQSGEGR